jgi:hypothetical protein
MILNSKPIQTKKGIDIIFKSIKICFETNIFMNQAKQMKIILFLSLYSSITELITFILEIIRKYYSSLCRFCFTSLLL